MIKNIKIKGLIIVFIIIWAMQAKAQQTPSPASKSYRCKVVTGTKGDLNAHMISPFMQGCNQSAESQMLRGVPPGLAYAQTNSDTIDILEYEINLDITDFISKMIRGNCKITFTPKMDGINTINLDLLKLTIDSVTSGAGFLTFNYNDTLLEVNFGSTFNLGDTGEVIVYYRGSPQIDPSGWGGFYFLGNYAFNLGVGFDSDPHNYGRVWFPCFDNFVERSTYQFNIITSGGKKAFCNGYLAGETVLSGDTVSRRWKMDYEIPTYLACVAVSDYETVSMTHNGINGAIPIELYGRAPDTVNLKNSFANLGGAISAFENSYGPYRWNKVGYSLVPFSSGAMEHATNIAYPRDAADGSLFFEDLMAHELSHQWWGNLATCESAGEMWLNEGMASYSEFLFNEKVYDKDAYMQLVRTNHEYVMHLVHINENGYRALVGIPHEYTYGDHVYKKGADVAHTLRGYLGDSLFFFGLKSFLANNQFTHINSARFRDHLTNATGVDLYDFFDKWVFRPGFPHFSIDSVQITPNGPNFNVKVYVKQKLTAATAYFKNAPLEITFYDAGWNSQTVTMIIPGAAASASYTIPFNPVFTAINADGKISDAISSDMKVLNTPGNYKFVNNQGAHLSVNVSSITDSALLRVEHNWTAPDPFIGPSKYKLCPNRYWKIDGIFPSVYSMNGTVFYDGRQPATPPYSSYYDHGLFKDSTDHEDSLVLLYRQDAGKNWGEYAFYIKNIISPNDKWGQILIDSIVAGEYVFALKGDIFKNSTSVSSITHVTCNGLCGGSASLTASGGTAPYTYLWDLQAGGQTSSTASGLCAGVYTVTVTDASAKTVIVSATVSQPDSLNGNIYKTAETCNGCMDATMTLSATGGTTPYTYLWDDPANQTTFKATGLSDAAIYSVSVSDANGCTFNVSGVTIGESEPLQPGLKILVFPNPTENTFTIEAETDFPAGTIINIVDLKGNTVYRKILKKKQSQVTVGSKLWVQGIYILQISDGDISMYKGKIVIAR